MFKTLTAPVNRPKILSLVSLFILVLSLVYSVTLNAQLNTRGQKGQWTMEPNAFRSPMIAAHVSVLPNGKVMAWGTQNAGGTVIQLWRPDGICPGDPEECFKQYTLPLSYDSLFCSGTSFLPDGRLVVAGGSALTGPLKGTRKAALYDYSTATWSPLPLMNFERWYPTNLTLPNGSTLVWGGDIVDRPFPSPALINPIPQVLEKQANGDLTWRELGPNVVHPEAEFRYYSWLSMVSTGKVLVTVGIEQKSYLLTLAENYLLARDFFYPYPFHPTDPGQDGDLKDTHHAGSLIVLEKDQVMAVGGSSDLPTRTAERLDLTLPSPEWKKVGRLNIERRQHNATILADGKVLISGGNKGDSFNNTCPEHAVYLAELWNPAAPGNPDEDGYWKQMAVATQKRMYHSTAVLLPDARVLTGGSWAQGKDGNHVFMTTSPCQEVLEDNFNIEIFSPPYLFNKSGVPAVRPVITSTQPAPPAYGLPFSFTVTDAGPESFVTLVRLPSTTHSFNQNQGFRKLIPTINGQNFSINIPGNRNELVPGHYMMFVVNAFGVPSVAKIIQIL